MSNFFETIVGKLKGCGFLEYPTRRQGLKSKVAVLVSDSELVVVHGLYKSEYDKRATERAAIVEDDPIVTQTYPEQDRLEAIQYEFDKHIEQVIVPIIDYYIKKIGLKSVKFIMESGGALKLPTELLASKGIKVFTGAEAKDIHIDIPGIGAFTS
jgi:hypothetical protein